MYNEFILAVVVGCILFVLLSLFIVAFVIRYNQKQLEFAAAKKSMELAFQNESNKAQLELSEQLLQKVSQEIHDNIGATLTLAKMQLTTANDSTVGERSKTTIELLTRSIQDLRNLSKSINGTYMLENGLEKAIQRELGFVSLAGVIRTEMVWPEIHIDLSDQLEIVIFRAVQEAINNAVKHANASLIKVEALCLDDRLVFIVSDDGKGMDMDQVEKSVGLNSLKARMMAIGGQFDIESAPDQGTAIQYILYTETS
jgi:two-component system, NarL family, sensor kinase